MDYGLDILIQLLVRYHIVADALMTLSLYDRDWSYFFEISKLSKFNYVFRKLPFTTIGLITVFLIIGVRQRQGFLKVYL